MSDTPTITDLGQAPEFFDAVADTLVRRYHRHSTVSIAKLFDR